MYADNATWYLKVTIQDGTSECTNFIQLAIDVQDIPTLDTLASATEICQSTNSSPDNNNAACDGETNSFTFTVTPSIANVSADYGYVYSFSIPTTSSLGGYSVT